MAVVNYRTSSPQEINEPLPFIPFALVTVIFLHIIVAVVYNTKRNKEGPPTTTTPTAVDSGQTRPTTSTTHSSQNPHNTDNSLYFFICIPVLLLLPGLGGVIYWRCRGQRRGQADGQEQRRVNREQKSQDEVTYSTVVHSNTTTTTTVTHIGEKTEYATIRLNE
ncbi:hypothetical protein MHYP_G00050280 [Metynnis hypsauchen]